MSALPPSPASTLRRPSRSPHRGGRHSSRSPASCCSARALWIHAKALLAQVLLERAFAASLATGGAVKPWSWADTWPVARIEVPRPAPQRDRAGRRQRPGARLRPRPCRAHARRRRARHRRLRRAPRHPLRLSRRGARSATRSASPGATASASASASPARRSCAGTRPASIPPRAGRHLVLATCWPLDGNSPARCATSCTPSWCWGRRCERVLQGGRRRVSRL